MPPPTWPLNSRARRTLACWKRFLPHAVRTGWLALLVALHSPAFGQEEAPDDQLEVVLAALPHVRSALPQGTAVLDPGKLCSARLFGWQCPDALRAAADELGLRLHSREFTHVCLAGPPTCRLIGTQSLIVPSQLEIDGSTARLLVEVWWQTGNRARPLGHQRSRLTLVRQRDGWRFTGKQPLLPP